MCQSWVVHGSLRHFFRADLEKACQRNRIALRGNRTPGGSISTIQGYCSYGNDPGYHYPINACDEEIQRGRNDDEGNGNASLQFLAPILERGNDRERLSAKRGTFFFNGNNWGCIYAEDEAKRVKYAYDKGHQIASHTYAWSHAHLTHLTWDQQALQRITGIVPAFARPRTFPCPSLDSTPPNRAAVTFAQLPRIQRPPCEVAGMRGQMLVNWDFDSGDSVGKTAAQSNEPYDELAAAHPDTVLALNHEVYSYCKHRLPSLPPCPGVLMIVRCGHRAQVVVPRAIAALQKAGYKLVSVAECLGMEPYQRVGAPGVRDASWTCCVQRSADLRGRCGLLRAK
ncbi:putative carbohydrate esterase family 4 protein [Lyophyllum shimeji]|uniref:Carbohydrate esterase family 4 protein n=1 Tax=Lyophyllum shimeji TaxID=47721 RepID=A0A9P3PZN9_LYOSH|nr:putative carbohydrate esterase family 4 protein [Lyophyllum shimeji]